MLFDVVWEYSSCLPTEIIILDVCMAPPAQYKGNQVGQCPQCDYVCLDTYILISYVFP